jgi:hypothetical protein
MIRYLVYLKLKVIAEVSPDLNFYGICATCFLLTAASMSEIRLVQKNTLSPQSKDRLLVKTNVVGVSLYTTNRSQTTDINGRIICGQTIDLAFGKK